MILDIDENIRNIEKCFNVGRWINNDEIVWALVENDKPTLARFRILKDRIETAKASVIEAYNSAPQEATKQAILGGLIPKDLVAEPTEKEIVAAIRDV